MNDEEKEGVILEFFNKTDRASGGLLVKALATRAYKLGRRGVSPKSAFDDAVGIVDIVTLLAAGAGSFLMLEASMQNDMRSVGAQLGDASRSNAFHTSPEQATQDAISAAVKAFVEALPKSSKEN
jgi:hypothetical protein